jgi:chromosome segregation ATPase
MPTIESMSLEEVNATLAQLRARQRILKKSSKVTERKIGTLARRRERLMQHIHYIDEQILQLRREAGLPVESATPRRQGGPPTALG